MGFDLRVRRAVRVLENGGVVAYPTESVFGLGCDPLDAVAVTRILDLKGRPVTAGFILIGAELDDVLPWLDVDEKQLATMNATWPGPVTWVAPCHPDVPAWITGGRDTVALRVTAHPVAAALCRGFGRAIVSTSANRRGRPPVRSTLGIRLRFPSEQIDYVLPGSSDMTGRPTEIRDLRSGRILRAG
jgi:L-threonylcarbamoyladenylate synthase